MKWQVVCSRGRAFCAALVLATLGAFDGAGAHTGSAKKAVEPAPMSSQALYNHAKPSVLKLATIAGGSDKPTLHGSAFLVDDTGHAVTNFHVVERALTKPKVFSLMASAAGQPVGPAEVVAVDVVNDLAIVRIDAARGRPHLAWRTGPGEMPRGQTLFAMGDPMDLGLTITSGTYNGRLAGPGAVLLHFGGALNSGMSGGPAFDAQGRVVGVNAARSSSGEQIGFLIPAERAVALLDVVQRRAKPLAAEDDATLWHGIAEQLLAYQSVWAEAALAQAWQQRTMGHYKVPVFLTDSLVCGSGSNAGETPLPANLSTQLQCAMRKTVSLGDGLRSGNLWFTHHVEESVRLSDWQMARVLQDRLSTDLLAPQSQELGRQVCRDQELALGASGRQTVRLVWCVQPYRKMAGVYDVVMGAVTRQDGGHALVSRLGLEGVSWDTGQRFTRRFLEGMQ